MTRLFVITIKFIYGLFILWLGVLAPLIYFDTFAANHHIQPYHFALFEANARTNSLPAGATESQSAPQIVPRFTHQQDVISAGSPFSGTAHALQWSLSQLFLIAGGIGLLLLLSGRLNRAGQLPAVSTYLPAPDPPPRPA